MKKNKKKLDQGRRKNAFGKGKKRIKQKGQRK